MTPLRRSLTSALVVTTIAATAGCGLFGDSGPTAAEAGKQLRKDVKKLLDKTRESSELSITNVQITKAARQNQPCTEDSEARRKFVAQASLKLDGGNVDQDLDQGTSATSVILQELGYDEQKSRGSDPPDDRRITGTKNDGRLSITIRMSGDGSTYKVVAKTSCLRTG